MDPQHLLELRELEDRYWWHVAKRQLVTELVTKQFPAPGRLVEGGVGACKNLLEFQSLGYDVAGFDISAEAVAFGEQRGLQDVAVHDLGQPWPLPDASANVVVMLDVLEHLENPVLVMQHASRVLQPGGGIVFTVPAYPWLFSNWDKRLGHFRRYTRTMLKRQAGEAGLAVARLNYWNAFTLPPALLMRMVERVRQRDEAPEFPRVSQLTNRLLLTAAACERAWIRRLPSPCGLSLFGVLRK